MKLSIVIPCYNAENYIKECLASVLPHAHGEIELLIVNDGSTDNSLEIIESLLNEYQESNVRLVNQENKGVSAARNEGIRLAKGKFICFLDADDFYNDNFWHIIPKIINHTECDILEFNGSLFEGSTDNIVEHIDACAIHGEVDICNYTKLEPAFRRCKWYPWARVFKKSLFNGITFPEGRLFEDMITIPKLYVKSSRIIGINESLVWYRFNKKSITQTFRKTDISDLAYVLSQYAGMVSKSDNAKELNKVIYLSAHRVYNLIKYSMVNNQCHNIARSDISLISNSLMVFRNNFKITKQLQIYFLPTYLRLVLAIRKK